MAQVVAIKVNQVKGVQKDACIIVPVANAIEICEAILAAGDSLRVNAARG